MLRQQEEDMHRRSLEARDPITSYTSLESSLIQEMERSHIHEKMMEREEGRQKQKEMTR